tara:strand:+ start:346 stop:666 length:321 start_codon:yes stop_codon:yes gene_type:complete
MQDKTDKLLKKERNFVSNKQANKDSDYGNYGKGADPRFSRKRGKSKAVASDIKINKKIRKKLRSDAKGTVYDRNIDPRFAPDRKTSKSAQQAIKRRKRRRAARKKK